MPTFPVKGILLGISPLNGGKTRKIMQILIQMKKKTNNRLKYDTFFSFTLKQNKTAEFIGKTSEPSRT